jgi:fatty acid synthase subunit beta
LQILNTGIIPGNRNADNIDEKLTEFNCLLFLSRTIRTTGIRAAILKSFGFGQVGGEVLVIHPDYLFQAIDKAKVAEYADKRMKRQAKTFRYLQDSLIGVASLVQAKNEPPYSAELESKVYLNPAARAEYDAAKNSWTFKAASVEKTQAEVLFDTKPDGISAMLSAVGNVSGIGVDVQLVSEINIDDETFLQRNFTEAERQYCTRQPDVKASFAGRWAAKESVIKALCNASDCRPDWLEGSGGALSGMEIMPDASGAPTVAFVGNLAGRMTVTPKVSISHSGAYAVAIAVINK